MGFHPSRCQVLLMTNGNQAARGVWRAYLGLVALILGYIGIYLCRKNFGVAIEGIREEFSASNTTIALIGSVSTLAYAFGKIAWGPIVDSLGGKKGVLASILLVCLFGALGGVAPTVTTLLVIYSLNRFSGSGAWGGMVKSTASWFPSSMLGWAMGLLSLSFVFGGAIAVLIAGAISEITNSWRWVMGAPACLTLLALLLCRVLVPDDTSASEESECEGLKLKEGNKQGLVGQLLAYLKSPEFRHLFRERRFWIVCGLSFVLTMMRETFNTWTYDFLTVEGVGSSKIVRAVTSSAFDFSGGLGILAMGWAYDRLNDFWRRWVLVVLLGLLSVLLFFLNDIAGYSVAAAALGVGAVGILIYGPYSLLAGVFAIEVGGEARAATTAGWVDALGYIGAAIAGVAFGAVLDQGGYGLGFKALAFVTMIASFLCLFVGDDGRSKKSKV